MPPEMKTPSGLPLELAAIAYLIATVGYMLWLLSRRRAIGLFGSLMMAAGTALAGWYMAARWLAAGRPPLANQFESLVAFAFCVGVVWLIIERITGLRHGGAGASFIAMLSLAATWLTDDALEPLLPALQDNFWLTIHVALCFLGYAGFTAAFVLSLLHLRRSDLRINRAGTLVVWLLLLWVGAAKIAFAVPPSEVLQWKLLKWVLPALLAISGTVLVILSGDMPVLPPNRRINRACILLLILIVLVASGAMLLISGLPLPTRPAAEGGFADEVLDLGACVRVLWLPLLLWGGAIAAVMALGDMTERRDSGDKLENAAYLSVLFAFPFLGAGIVTGSIWAKQAWGRYWGWDPKETSSLVAWLIYAAYLHLRLISKKKRQELSWVLIFGFFMVLFTYFGVNYLSLLGVDSLHMYGFD